MLMFIAGFLTCLVLVLAAAWFLFWVLQPDMIPGDKVPTVDRPNP